MELFMTLEAQKIKLLDKIFNEVEKKLSFVTDTDAGLEDVDNYGTEFRSIAIIPTCLDDDFWEALGWKERRQIWRKKKRRIYGFVWIITNLKGQLPKTSDCCLLT